MRTVVVMRTGPELGAAPNENFRTARRNLMRRHMLNACAYWEYEVDNDVLGDSATH